MSTVAVAGSCVATVMITNSTVVLLFVVSEFCIAAVLRSVKANAFQ